MANAQHVRPAQGEEEIDLELEDTPEVRELEEGHQAPILVLSRDGSLIETVKKAAPRGAPVAHAPDLDHVAGQLSQLKPGVLVADTASIADVTSMVAQLTQHFPELVVVVAGKREDSGSLMQLTATGRIFRFLLTPLSHGQTRLALEAAVKQHEDLAAAGERLGGAVASEDGGKNYAITYAALAAGLLIVIGGIWFGINRFTGESEAPLVSHPVAPAGTPSDVPERPDPVQAELALAKDAFEQGKLLEPAGESALDLYRSALALDPDNEAARTGIRGVTDKILERAEAALTAERLEEAIRNIEIARDIDAAHPRLSFLDTQIARERERIKLTQAHEIGTRVRTLVAQANDRMQNGRLLTPSGASARDALLEARRLDPTDPTVAQGIRELSALLAQNARKAIAAGKPDEAQTLVSAARQLGSAGAALAAVERSLNEATRAAAVGTEPHGGAAAAVNAIADALAADVRQRLSAGKLIDPPGDSARDALAKLAAAEPGAPVTEELTRALTTRLLDAGKQAMSAKAFERSAQLIAAARQVGAHYSEPTIAQAERDLRAAREAHALESSVVSAAQLKRTRMINPVYPEAARKRGIEGWVELAFTVMPNGSVEDVEVRNSSPADVFDDAAVRAIRGWRFEPVERNGQRISQRAMVRLRFEQSNQ